MRDQTDWEPWTREKYHSPAWGQLERALLEVAIAEWKFFVSWMELYGYEEAVAVMERGDRE